MRALSNCRHDTNRRGNILMSGKVQPPATAFSGPLQRRERIPAQAHMEWVKRLPCVACGLPDHSDAHHIKNDITENCDLVRVGKMIEFQWLTEDGPRVLAEWHHDDRSKRQGPLRPKGRTMKDYNIWMRPADLVLGKRASGTQKPDDCWTVPLCRPCHDNLHWTGEALFWSLHFGVPKPVAVGKSCIIALALWAETGDDERGHQIINLNR